MIALSKHGRVKHFVKIIDRNKITIVNQLYLKAWYTSNEKSLF